MVFPPAVTVERGITVFATQMTFKIQPDLKNLNLLTQNYGFQNWYPHLFSVARHSFHMSSRESLELQDEAIDYVVQAGGWKPHEPRSPFKTVS